MKKAGEYFILTFIIYLIGNLIWFLTLIFQQPLFGSDYFDTILLVIIFTIFGILGLIASIIFYNEVKKSGV